MKSLTAKQTVEWCRNLGVPTDTKRGLSTEILGNRFGLPSETNDRQLFAESQVEHFSNDSRVLAWITEWGVWPSVDRLDEFLSIRAAAGEQRQLQEIPAQLIGRDEFDYLRSITVCAVASLWDICLVGAKGRKILFCSHDEWGGSRGIPTKPNKAQK